MANTNQTDHDIAVRQAKILFKIAVGMLVIAIAVYCWRFSGREISDAPANWGVLGDYFGGTLGPTFNLITLYLLVTNLRLQVKQMQDTTANSRAAERHTRTQLKLQARQMREARREAAIAESNMRAQYESVLAQSFDQTFFSWLRSYRDIVDEVKTGGMNGRKALHHLWTAKMNSAMFVPDVSRLADGFSEDLIRARLYATPPKKSHYDRMIAAAIIATYEELYRSHKHQLDTMFRTLYRLVRWIDESDITPKQKFNYVGIVRSQVSAIELQYIFMNAFTARGEKFRPLIERYAMLDNMELSEEEVETFDVLRTEGTLFGHIKLSDFAFSSDAAKAFIETSMSPKLIP